MGSRSPDPLERINALLLMLGGLEGTKNNGVQLLKATRSGDDASKEVNFDLNWVLDPAVKPSAEQLEALGADGMAARLRMLEQQGVQF